MTRTDLPLLGEDARSAAAESDQGPTRFAVARTVFGVIWAIDAVLKWLPGFRSGLLDMLHDAGQGQPHWLAPWFRFWPALITHSPTAFGVMIALAESAIAVGLLLGVAQRATFGFGTLFALLIWGIGEGFGGPYGAGSTDIGCAVIYAVVFVVLWIAVPRAVRAAAPGLDHRLSTYSAMRWATFR